MSRPEQFPSKSGYALVTGGSVRIGAEICRTLGRDGWRVVVHYRHSATKAEALVAELNGMGVRAGTVSADLSGPEPQALFSRVDPAFGHCNLLVNNAATFEYDDVATISAASFDPLIAANLRAPLLLSRGFREQLPRDACGLIVNLLDQKVFNLNPDFLSYTVAKSALLSATEMLALALAPHIRVCAVAPGLSLRSGEQTKDGFDAVHGETPLGFGSEPRDIAEAISFIARMPAMTGSTIIVDGGQSLVKRSRDVMFSYQGDAAAPTPPTPRGA